MITRKYSLVVEGDESGYSAYIPEVPTILVTGRTMKELTDRASEAVRFYWEFMEADGSPTSTMCEIEVELPV